jgi:glucose-1-phosphate cytidylyltransferase
MTGGRLLNLRPLLEDEDSFMLTYGDGVSDIDINSLLEFHNNHNKIATISAVRPPARFGTMVFNGDMVKEFEEKPQTGEGWIKGGFFVFRKQIFNDLKDDQTILEREPLEKLALDNELMAYKHDGFWQAMDTLRDKINLEEAWESGTPEWKSWIDK